MKMNGSTTMRKSYLRMRLLKCNQGRPLGKSRDQGRHQDRKLSQREFLQDKHLGWDQEQTQDPHLGPRVLLVVETVMKRNGSTIMKKMKMNLLTTVPQLLLIQKSK